MTTALLLSVVLWLPVQDPTGRPEQSAQDRHEKKAEPPKRGDVVVAKGCLRGSVLESAQLQSPNGFGLAEVISYRLTGEKRLLEEIRKDHDKHADIITGELRTDLPTQTETRGGKIGNTRIVIGAGPSRPMMPEGPPPMPVLRVKSFEHTGVPCQ